MCPVGVPVHFNAVVGCVSHSNVTIAIKGNATPWQQKLAVLPTRDLRAADGAHDAGARHGDGAQSPRCVMPPR